MVTLQAKNDVTVELKRHKHTFRPIRTVNHIAPLSIEPETIDDGSHLKLTCSLHDDLIPIYDQSNII